ncbi:glycosyltransferase family 39 protein [Paenibacillus sp. HWE-109]|uniref:ArnT family glycosyltransferase n=1 Tax=Paenibacillus sp. HWE-109 TaxID=1306526 RepID=UPI001EDE5DC2|nr:glycosyltransferase family 39 protein [Paenibacillus sp. HWE-109]UKS30121.1 glycosyltransferase family 39 protein [Paenibacillus sp. HWE-109]
MKRSIHFGLLLLMAAALLVRLHYVLEAEYPPLEWDQLEYTKTAVQLLEKGIYAYRDSVPNALVTPGFPLILAAIFKVTGHESLESALMAVRLLNCFVSLGAILFIFLIGKRLFHPLTGLIAAGFAAVYPSYVWSTSLILTEVPFLTVFMALLYVQVRMIQENKWKDHVWMGALLGICVLIRPNVLPLALLPYVFIWIRSRQVETRYAFLGLASFVCVMLPWWIRNGLVFHSFVFIAKGEAGNPFLGGTDPYFQNTIDWDHIDKDRQFAEGVQRIKEGMMTDPVLWIKWMTIGKLAVFFKTMWVGPYPFSVPAWYTNILTHLHSFLIAIGSVTMLVIGSRKWELAYLAAAFLTFLGIHMLFIPVDRYLYGMLPFLMLASAYAITQAIFLLRYAWSTSLQQWKGL